MLSLFVFLVVMFIFLYVIPTVIAWLGFRHDLYSIKNAKIIFKDERWVEPKARYMIAIFGTFIPGLNCKYALIVTEWFADYFKDLMLGRTNTSLETKNWHNIANKVFQQKKN